MAILEPPISSHRVRSTAAVLYERQLADSVPARAENAVLKQKVDELSQRVKELVVENESLKAEVEMYRAEAALPTFSKLALGQSEESPMHVDQQPLAFVKAGNGVYPKQVLEDMTLLHDSSNPLACTLSEDLTLVATGGANRTVSLVAWGNPSIRCQVSLDAPVIAVGFGPKGWLAAGCMDGRIALLRYEHSSSNGLQASLVDQQPEGHRKFVKSVVWKDNLLASSSADGSMHVYRVDDSLTKVTSMHFDGAVEATCFTQTHLVCYARGSPFLRFFELENDFEPTQINLNGSGAGFNEHVSFCVMDLKVHGEYLAAATDTSRNIVLDHTGKIVRNLYGHQNDGFSQPKLCWSSNGAYVLGNTQDDSMVCVWDVASGELVERLDGHGAPIRDIFSCGDLMVTTAFDKAVKVWSEPMMED